MTQSGPAAKPSSTSKPTRMKNTKKTKKRSREDATQHSPVALPAAKRVHADNSTDKYVTNDHPKSTQINKTEPHTLDPNRSETTFSFAPSLVENLSAYEVTKMNIISSAQIQAKVTRLLDTLGTFSFVAPTKPSVVALHAKGPVSSKLITIVEITKREIDKTGGKWYQYNSLEQALIVRDKFSAEMSIADDVVELKGSANADVVDADGNDDKNHDVETIFETMKTPFERAIDGKPKVRAVPIMTIFLSRIRIESLKKIYGEQTNALT